MFAARVRASLKPLLRGRHSYPLSRSCEVAASLRRVLLDRCNNEGESGNRVGTKLINRGYRSSSPQCYSLESDVGVKTHTSASFSSLEDHFFSELGSVEKDRNSNMVVELLTKMPVPFQVKKPELSQETKRRKTKKKKKHGQASDSTSKLKLLTEKPEVSWKTNGKSKAGTHASSLARNVTDSFSEPTELSSRVPDHEAKAQSITSLCSDEENETTSIGSSLEGLARVDEDSVDVLFRESLELLLVPCYRLNDATVDHSQRTAEIAPEAEETCRDQMGMRISSSFEDMEKQLRVPESSIQ